MTDKKRYEYRSCYAVMGTLTGAQKASRALANAAIPSSVVKIDSSSGTRGCVWGIGFACNQAENVRSVLSSSGINVRSWRTNE